MKVLSVCIGVNNTVDFSKLDNAINDAISIEGVFKSFEYDTILHTDISLKYWVTLLGTLEDKLNEYDAFIFFYAGHGLEFLGENYLTVADTSQMGDSKAYFDYTSIKLSDILNLHKNNQSLAKIIIIDACRDSPEGIRGAHTQEFAPIATPKGTLIAFSTTSGQKAADLGYPHNGLYTGTLIHHLKNNSNIQAESLFKKVRQSVYSLSEGKKITWEHTSLINEFFFQKPLSKVIDYGYPSIYINDSTYNYSDTIISEIILMFQTSDWHKQDKAMNIFLQIPIQQLSKNEKFLIGRWIVRSFSNGTFGVQNLMADNNNRIQFLNNYLEPTHENHLLNGMLFELYFNNSGQFRFNSEYNHISNILIELRNNDLFRMSFSYLNKILQPHNGSLFYYPINSDNNESVNFDINAKEGQDVIGDSLQTINTIHYKTRDIKNDVISKVGNYPGQYDKFKNLLTSLNIPKDLITINSNIPLNNIGIN